jgi:hypothetical protein
MDMFILAQVASKLDISGVLCLASILFLIIAIAAYITGPWGGSCICLIFFIIAIFATGDSGVNGSGGPSPFNVKANRVIIANLSQSKMISRPGSFALDRGNAMMRLKVKPGYEYDSNVKEVLWIPDEEMMIKDGLFKVKSTGKVAADDDWYYWDRTIDPVNVDVADGGYGVPQWLYHPASPVYIFGLGSLPALLGGMFVASKLFG